MKYEFVVKKLFHYSTGWTWDDVAVFTSRGRAEAFIEGYCEACDDHDYSPPEFRIVKERVRDQ